MNEIRAKISPKTSWSARRMEKPSLGFRVVPPEWAEKVEIGL
jgi:hypothetical protein